MTNGALYGITELAVATGQRRDTLSQWYRRGKLPEPAARLAMGPVWMGPSIEAWIQGHRRPGRDGADLEVESGSGHTPEAGVPGQSEVPAVAGQNHSVVVAHEQHRIADALHRLGFGSAIVAQVVDELVARLNDPALRVSGSLGQWCVERATELSNEIAGSRQWPTSPGPDADDSEELCPHGEGWLSCPTCVAAGEDLRRRGLRAIWAALGRRPDVEDGV